MIYFKGSFSSYQSRFRTESFTAGTFQDVNIAIALDLPLAMARVTVRKLLFGLICGGGEKQEKVQRLNCR